jgi:isoleucyl-tRNA synthetase
VHLADFPADVDRWRNPALVDEWTKLIELRTQVNLALEQERQKKVIGAPLEAHVRLTASGAIYDRLLAHEADLPMLFITSQVSLARGNAAASDAGEVRVEIAVGRADGVKCQRCWRYVPSISTEPDTEGLCSRCVEALGLVGQSSQTSA